MTGKCKILRGTLHMKMSGKRMETLKVRKTEWMRQEEEIRNAEIS